jgi:hypothetical protein
MASGTATLAAAAAKARRVRRVFISAFSQLLFLRKRR